MTKKVVIVLGALAVLVLGLVFAVPSGGSSEANGRRVLVLGFDGMDPVLTEELMNQGRLPHFAELRDSGCFMPLGSSTPPQSPVAWSDFISGADARVHAVFDFIHRNPDDEYEHPKGNKRRRIAPYLSTSKVEEPDTWTVGDYEIPKPWGGGGTKQLRRGKPFWEYLTAAGVPTSIFRVPANFPPGKSKGAHFCCLSGMGTPDLLGTYGTFAAYAVDAYGLSESKLARHVGGGDFYRLGAAEKVEHELTIQDWRGLSSRLRKKLHFSKDEMLLGFVGRMTGADHSELLRLFTSEPDRRAVERLRTRSQSVQTADEWTGWLVGPENFAIKEAKEGDRPAMEIPFRLTRDPQYDVCSIEVQGRVLVLKPGEWSAWERIEFKTGLPMMNMAAICQFYLPEVRPQIRLYVTPFNIDPEEPVLQISEPDDYAADIAAENGLYYTLGMPEDYSALREDAINDGEYLSQTDVVLNERLTQLDYNLKRFKEGFLFFYFGSTDLIPHMFWRHRDPEHPLYDPEQAAKYGTVIEDLYVKMDGALATAMKVLHEDDTVIVLSDHGFTTFRRGFNLNTWLRDNGYIGIKGPGLGGKDNLFVNCDWSGTRAYGLGINSLYVNLRGREFGGIVVSGGQRDALLNELRDKLLEVTDPENGERVIAQVYRTDEIFPGADPDVAPDLLIGYARGYRASWDTILGEMPDGHVEDNVERWSGDHCVATHLVPGIILSNRKIRITEPRLIDVAPTILAEFGIDRPAAMQGRPMF